MNKIIKSSYLKGKNNKIIILILKMIIYK